MLTTFRTGFIAIVGRPNVGKSTLLNHLIGQKISITSRKAQTTRHKITGIETDENTQYIFVDTPGYQTRHLNTLNNLLNRSVTQALSEVDVVVFVIESERFGDADREVMALLPRNVPVLLVLNKTDMMEDKKQLLPFMANMALEFPFVSLIPASAKQGTQIEDIKLAIRPLLPEGQALFDVNQVTDRSERFLASELIREKIFRLSGEELPYAVSVAIESFVLDGALRRIHATVLVDKDGQKAILIGKNGEKMKAIATQARQDMEKLFDGKVYLEVWVKVKNGWSDDLRTLKSLGYD